MNIQGQVTSLVQKQRQGQIRAAATTIMNDAFALYGLFDWLGTGNNVVRFYNPNSSPQERDFTATELTDGTYASWYVSGTTDIYKFYDQKGVSDYDMVAAGSGFSSAAHYISATNEADFLATGYYQYSYYQTTSSSAITSAFSDIQTTSANTMVMSLRKTGNNLQDLPVSGRNVIGMRDGFTPASFTSANHKGLKIKQSMYSSAVQLTYRATNNSGQVSTATTDLGTTLDTFAGGINVGGGGPNDDFDMFVDGSQTVDEDYDISAFTSIARFQLGDNKLRTQGDIFFNKQLTQDEHNEVHTIMSAHY